MQLPVRKKGRTRSTSAARKKKSRDRKDDEISNTERDKNMKVSTVDTESSVKDNEKGARKNDSINVDQTTEIQQAKADDKQNLVSNITGPDIKASQTRQSKKRKVDQVDSQESSEATQFSSQIVPSATDASS